MPDEPNTQGTPPQTPTPEVPAQPYFQPQQPPEAFGAQSVSEPQPFQPQPPQQFTDYSLVPAVPPKKSRKKLFIITGIVVAALALLGGGSALAYNLWYQNPDKVVTDALVDALTAKTINATGTIGQEMKDGSFKVDISGRNDQNSNSTFAAKLTFTTKDTGTITADGEAIYGSNGDIYLKLNNAQDLANTIEKQSNGLITFAPFNKVIQKIDGHWIKIGKDDLGDISPEAQKTQNCVADVMNSYENDASFHATVKNEIETLYGTHRFIVVGNKLGSRTINGVGSLGYSLSIDQKVAKDFFTGINDTQIGKKLKACDTTINFGDIVDGVDTSTKDSTTDMQLWASRFGHTITEFNLTNTDKDGTKSTVLVNPIFNKNESVVIPSDSISLSELKNDIEAAYMDYFQSVMASNSSDTTSSTLFN